MKLVVSRCESTHPLHSAADRSHIWEHNGIKGGLHEQKKLTDRCHQRAIDFLTFYVFFFFLQTEIDS